MSSYLELLEKNGVFEFENNRLRDYIKYISSNLYDNYLKGPLQKYFINVIFLDYEKIYKNKDFCKISINNLHVEWIKHLDIYVCLSEYGDDAFTFDTKLAEETNFFKINENHIIEKATIIISYSNDIDYYSVLMHELKHLYDRTHFLNIWRGDCNYSLSHRADYDINLFTLDTDASKLSIDEIFCIINESMYYSNFSEQHAFMETINIEIQRFFENKRKFLNPFHNKEMFFMKSSKELYNVYILEHLIKQIMILNDIKKQDFWNSYGNELMASYYNFNNFNNILTYIYKKIHKIVNHSRNLFNCYWDKNNINDIYDLNENAKVKLIKGSRKYTNRNLHS